MYSDVSDKDSLIDLTDEDFEEDHSKGSQKKPKQTEKENPVEDSSSERKTTRDPSYKSEDPQCEDQTGHPKLETDDQMLDKLNLIADTVNPVIDDDYWRKRRESNLCIRLEMAAQKLKQ